MSGDIYHLKLAVLRMLQVDFSVQRSLKVEGSIKRGSPLHKRVTACVNSEGYIVGIIC